MGWKKRNYDESEDEDEMDEDAEDGSEEESGQSEISYTVELAKSGRSQCRGCNTNIANRSLRVGENYEDPEYGNTCRWYHPHCITLAAGVEANSIAGYRSLGAANKTIINELIAKAGSSPLKRKADVLDSPQVSMMSTFPTSTFGIPSLPPIVFPSTTFSLPSLTTPSYTFTSEEQQQTKKIWYCFSKICFCHSKWTRRC